MLDWISVVAVYISVVAVYITKSTKCSGSCRNTNSVKFALNARSIRQYPDSPTRSRTTVLENSCSREQLFANGSGYLDTAVNSL